MDPSAATTATDVLIVGAGLSGIGMAAHLLAESPGTTFTILEARDATGGTWDLFRYPGIRSDSDMYTMGYSFKPWNHPETVAPGPLILDYIREAAAERGIDQHILLGHRVVETAWDSDTATWTVTVQTDDGLRTFTSSFLVNAVGYYRYEQGYTPDFAGRDQFRGDIIHPQHWPDDFDYDGKRIVVIGSGATAVTLVPNLAHTAGHVTMVQRSPTYMFSSPGVDALSQKLRGRIPDSWIYRLGRFRKTAFQMFSYQMARRNPRGVKEYLIDQVGQELQGAADIADFTPSYNPWDQRLCLVPDGDLFAAIREGRASVVTGGIRTFTPDGIEMDDGTHIPADAIITATGFDLLVGGGARMLVDTSEVDLTRTLVYKGMMFSDVPNFAFIVGYTNASWTLKADLVAEHFCRLINYMKRKGYSSVRARNTDLRMRLLPMMPLASGYIQRSSHLLPKEGDRSPWRLRQNYILDFITLRLRTVRDRELEFRRAPAAPSARNNRRGTTVVR